MKKILEFCPQCNKDTTHRQKKKSFQRKQRGETYSTVMLPLKCMVCNYLHGKMPINQGKKKQHLKLRQGEN